MTSITIPGAAVGLPSGKRLSFDRTRWVRYGLGVAVAGLLAADLTILMGHLRSDDTAGVSRQAPAVVADHAVPASPPVTAVQDANRFAGLLGGATDAATTAPPAVPAELTPAGSAGAAAPRTAPGPNLAGSGSPAAPKDNASLAPVTDVVRDIPVVGEVLAPVVDDVVAQVPAEVIDALPADNADADSTEETLDPPVSVPVTVPPQVGGLLP